MVLEKKSGQILTGTTAPSEADIKMWLEYHPTFEILCPTVKQSPYYSMYRMNLSY